MVIQVISAAQAVTRLDAFGAIIDARSPGEFAEDHLPGALNWPVLDDEERRIVGTEYKQISPFEARKRGAALVAKNIAAHIERDVMDKPKSWQPLVYCWRGGQRSGSMAWFLDQMGFRTHVIEGGYKAFRHTVLAELETLPLRLQFRVLCGKTGSGKTRLLHALQEDGGQVLDLEGLASHRGSVLGAVPGKPQPTQKAFETALWHVLRNFDPERPVFLESESRKIGQLRLPEALTQRMRKHSECLLVCLPDAARLTLLLQDYDFFVRDVELFCKHLDCLTEVQGRAVVAGWKAAAREGRVADVFLDLMHRHYDPGYMKSLEANFSGLSQARTMDLAGCAPDDMAAAARALLQG
jgi:tRNA 2-selenouridine synthase